jgi:pantoate--beta-alanine ligase
VEVCETIPDIRGRVWAARRAGRTIGFVPTMGALHEGHLSLMREARREHGLVAVSIFVNPTQFAPHEDLQKYPRPRDRDLELCASAGVDVVFYPTVAAMYPPDASTYVTVEGLTDRWEGAIRPGHFRGVTTVVLKLFQIVPADVAYFGQKDYQQQAVIRRMARDLDLPIEIRTCPTIRDADGLALSSRNAYLSAEERQAGLCLSRALRWGETEYQVGLSPEEISCGMQARIAAEPGMTLDYAVVADAVTLEPLTRRAAEVVALVAGRVGTTRLIDNAIWRE